MRVFKFLDHNEMAESRICMFKDVDLSNRLLSVVHFTLLDGWVKVLKKHDF